MHHFNGLTPAEAERLAMLAEEAGEIVQAVGKILRHGYASRHPDDLDGLDNREMLEREITDIRAVLEIMKGAGDVGLAGPLRVAARMTRKLKYTHHQERSE